MILPNSKEHSCVIIALSCVCLTRVGDDDEDAVGTVLDDLRDDVLEDVNVPLHQVEPAFTFLLTNASRHDYDT